MFMKRLFTLIIAFISAWFSAQATSYKPLALIHIFVVDVETGKLQSNQTVIIFKERIKAVGDFNAISISKGSLVINESGKYLIPSLWDAHVHLSYVGASTLPVLVDNGITSVRDLGSILSEVHLWQKQIAQGKLIGPRIKATGYNIESASWLKAVNHLIDSSAMLQSYHLFKIAPRFQVDNEAEARFAVDSLVHMGSDVIKFRNLDRKGFFALAKVTKQRNLLLVGHSPVNVSLAEASDAGMASIEHDETISNSLSEFDSISRIAQFKTLIKNGTMLTPTLIADYKSKLSTGKEMLSAIKDTSGQTDSRNAFVSKKLRNMWHLAYDTRSLGRSIDWDSFFKTSASEMQQAYRLGVQMLAGTDLGVILVYPATGLHEELKLMVNKLHMKPTQVLKSATVNPAKFFGLESVLGTIKASKYADLVVLNKNPLENISATQKIYAVILNGRYLAEQTLIKFY